MPEKVSAGQGWQEVEPAVGAKVPGLQGKHSEVKATPVMPMFLTSTGLGTLDQTEKAVDLGRNACSWIDTILTENR